MKSKLELPMTRTELASLTSELPHVRALLVVMLQRDWKQVVIRKALIQRPQQRKAVG